MNLADAAIRHVKMPARLADAVPARRVLERWLAGVDVRRYGLPAGAICVVRRARAPFAALAGGSTRDPLAAVMRDAVRPARAAFVGATAEAVWFADEAELLACMARDVLAGTLAARWWWPMLLGATPTVDSARRRWIAAPRIVPQALRQLAPDRTDLVWLEAIGAEGRAALLQALALEYPVGDAVRQAIAACESRTEVPGTPLALDTPLPRPDDANPSPQPTAAVPAVTAAEALLRLAHALLTDPSCAADTRFAALLCAPLAATASPATHGRNVRRSAPAYDPIDMPSEDRREPCVEARSQAAHSKPTLVRDSTSSAPPEAMSAIAAPASVAAAVHTNAGETRATSSAARATPQAPRATQLTGPVETVDTAFGGVFFLLNVALALGLYGDFTQPLHRGLQVSPWRFLRAAGRALGGRAFAADPLAALLFVRSPRQALPAAPPAWQVEPEWLLPFAADQRPWHAVVEPGAVRLLHPAGFTIARRPGNTDLAAMLAVVGYAGQGVLMHLAARKASRRSGLLDLLWPLLRARLAFSLGLPDGHAAAARLLALPARVAAGAARMDVHFALAALPLAVRVAGLDRDPGWVPASGCDFRFHFD